MRLCRRQGRTVSIAVPAQEGVPLVLMHRKICAGHRGFLAVEAVDEKKR